MGSFNESELRDLQVQLNQAIDKYVTGGQNYVSRAIVIGKAKEVIRNVSQPSDLTMQHATNMLELVIIRTLLELNVLNSIPKTGSISLRDLAATTGVQDSLLERMLRLAVGTGFIDQSENLEYQHTKFSDAYRQEPGPGNWFQFCYDESLMSMINFHEYLTVIRKDLREPQDHSISPYTSRHNQDGEYVWAIMSQFPGRMRQFQLGCAYQDGGFPVVGMYDFSQLASEDGNERASLVDIGGGQGQAIAQILQTFPQLRPEAMVLQDLPEPLELVKVTKTVPDSVQIMAHDFWTPQPIKNAKAYYLRRILHDYSDVNCVKILKHTCDAMGEDSKLLISDMVLPKKIDEINLSAAAIDTIMLTMGGKERTQEDFKRILDEAGLELVKIWSIAPGLAVGCIIEARKR